MANSTGEEQKPPKRGERATESMKLKKPIEKLIVSTIKYIVCFVEKPDRFEFQFIGTEIFVVAIDKNQQKFWKTKYLYNAEVYDSHGLKMTCAIFPTSFQMSDRYLLWRDKAYKIIRLN